MSVSVGGRLGRRARWSLCMLGTAVLALASQVPVARADLPGVHVVKAGESLIAIAVAYGATTEALAAANGLVDPNQLAIGQELVIPGSQAAAAAGPAGAGRYTVRPGDTLIGIAAHFDVDVDDLRRANGLGQSDLIRVGDELSIPGRPVPSTRGAAPRPAAVPSRYTVVAGDTLSGIAARLGVDQAELVAANQLSDPNHLRAGDELVVPGEQTPAPPALSNARQHVVQSGENLLRIAAAYGIEVGALATANGLGDLNRISAGQVLTIPGAGAPAAPAPSPAAPAPAAPPPPPAKAPPATAPPAGEWVAVKLTAYCMGGRMANGRPVHEGAAAADLSVYPLGTVIEVEGIGKFTIEDRFARDLGQQRLDLWMPDCGAALRFGIRYGNVRVVGG